MLKCIKCDSLFPDYYKKCVECDSELTKLQYKVIEQEEIVEISPFVEGGEIKDGEL